MMIGAKTKDVADDVGAVVWFAERLNVMCLGITRTVGKLDGMAANLTSELVNGASNDSFYARDVCAREGTLRAQSLRRVNTAVDAMLTV